MNRTTTEQHADAANPQEAGNPAFVYLATAVATVGGFLFGFDTAIIAGAIGFIMEYFEKIKHITLTPLQEGFAVSSVLIGCMIGASVAGFVSDRFGRKKVLFAAAIIFVFTAVLAAIPQTLTQFAIARLLMGIAVGIESVLSPLYIAEIAPANIRGRLVTLNHVALTIGMLSAYVIAIILEPLGAASNWRWMFASGAIPAGIFLIALAWIPESPRWLIERGLNDKAMSVLTKVGGSNRARVEMERIKSSIAEESGSISQLFAPGLRLALVVGVVLAILQQITGINVILYYAPEVFKNAGLATNQALWSSVLVGVVNLIANIVAVMIIDKVGRKPLLIFGTLSMGVFLGLTGLSFIPSLHISSVWTVIFILGYVTSFMVGLGPGFWTVVSEIFPTRVRGRAMGIATFFIWSSCFVVAQTFPSLLKLLGGPHTFWLYGLMCILTIVFTWIFVPETKGKTLEEIEKHWLARKY